MENITLINGNGYPMTKELPKLVILGYMNDVALEHIKENTGLIFQKDHWDNYIAQPTESYQIAALFMTYNFKTRYYDNWDYKNTLVLKGDHHVGFDVNSICYECVKENHIQSNIEPGDRLAC